MENKIPRIIHYCWFGGGNKTTLINMCIDSWKVFFPGFQFMEWNEKNTNIFLSFAREAMNQKKWAFVSDVVRLEKLYEMGGVYLDVDMLVLKNMEVLMQSNGFIGAQDEKYINGAIIGVLPRHPFIKICLDYYKNLSFDMQDVRNITIPTILTSLLRREFQFHGDFRSMLDFRGFFVYPPEYFYPLPFKKNISNKNYPEYLTNNSFSVHLWEASWVEYSEFHDLRKGRYKSAFKKMILNLKNGRQKISLNYLKRIASATADSFKNSA